MCFIHAYFFQLWICIIVYIWNNSILYNTSPEIHPNLLEVFCLLSWLTIRCKIHNLLTIFVSIYVSNVQLNVKQVTISYWYTTYCYSQSAWYFAAFLMRIRRYFKKNSLVFSNSFIKIGRMPVVENVRAVEMIALMTGCTHFKFTVLFVHKIVLNSWQSIIS